MSQSRKKLDIYQTSYNPAILTIVQHSKSIMQSSNKQHRIGSLVRLSIIITPYLFYLTGGKLGVVSVFKFLANLFSSKIFIFYLHFTANFCNSISIIHTPTDLFDYLLLYISMKYRLISKRFYPVYCWHTLCSLLVSRSLGKEVSIG